MVTILVVILIISVAILYAGLVFAWLAADNVLNQAANDLDALAQNHIQYTVNIDETVPVETSIAIKQDIPVPVSIEISHTLAIDTEVAFDDKLLVPVDLTIDQTIPIDTVIPFNGVFTVPVTLDLETLLPLAAQATPLGQDIVVPLDFGINDVLPVNTSLTLERNVQVPVNLEINQEFEATTTLFGQIITIPVTLDVSRIISASAALPPGPPLDFAANLTVKEILPPQAESALGAVGARTTETGLIIPLPSAEEVIANVPASRRTVQVEVPIAINQNIPVQMDVPLNLPIDNEIAIDMNQTFPIQMDVPVNLPIETEVIVPIDMLLPIALEVPVQMDVPFKKRPLAITCNNLAIGCGRDCGKMPYNNRWWLSCKC